MAAETQSNSLSESRIKNRAKGVLAAGLVLAITVAASNNYSSKATKSPKPENTAQEMARTSQLVRKYGDKIIFMAKQGDKRITVIPGIIDLSGQSQEREYVISVPNPEGAGFNSFGILAEPDGRIESSFLEIGAAKPFSQQTKPDSNGSHVTFGRIEGTQSYVFIQPLGQGVLTYNIDTSDKTKNQEYSGYRKIAHLSDDKIRQMAGGYLSDVEAIVDGVQVNNVT